MLHQIANDVCREIREYGDLSYQDVGDEIDTEWQVPWRWEKEQRQNLLKRDQEAKLVKAAKLTRPAFGEIMCRVLTKFVGRRFFMGPEEPYKPSWPMMEASEIYKIHHDELDREVQKMIDDLFSQGRSFDAQNEQASMGISRVIVYLIQEGLAKKGKSLAGDGDD